LAWINILYPADSVQITNSLFVIGTYGIIVGLNGGGVNTTVTGTKLDNVTIDSMSAVGYYINNVRDISLTACSAQAIGIGSLGTGKQITANAAGVRITGGIVQSSGGNGIAILAGSSMVMIDNTLILANNQDSHPFGFGISVDENTSHYSITNCVIAN